MLILAGSRRERLDALDIELRTTTAPISVSCDLRDSRCGSAIADAESPLGRLDGVTNAAGVVAFGALLDTPPSSAFV